MSLESDEPTYHFDPIKKDKIYKQIYDQIYQKIIKNKALGKDRKLPSERALMEQFAVSRASVREALRSLELMGIINIKPGGGAYIVEEDESIIKPLAMFFMMEKINADHFVDQFFDIRKIIETGTARLAAEKATSADKKKIGLYLEKLVKAFETNNTDTRVICNARFHYAIAEATHNRLLIQLFKTIQDTFIKTSETAIRNNVGREKILIDQHTAILNAIDKNKTDEAAKTMLIHLNFARSK